MLRELEYHIEYQNACDFPCWCGKQKSKSNPWRSKEENET